MPKTLTQRYPGRLVSVAVGEQHTVGAVLAELSRETDLGFEFVYGGIAALAGRPVGNITLALTGSPEAVATAVRRLGETAEVEVLS